MRSITIFLVFLFLKTFLAAQPLGYEIRTENSSAGGKLKLEVTLEFYPSRTDTSRFNLPSQINWSEGLHHCFRNFRVSGGRFMRVDSTQLWVIPGECLFLIPRHYQIFDVTVRWSNLPKRWVLQNSFNTGVLEQKFQATNLEWRHTNWVAGDFRILKGEALGKPFAFAIRGNWPFDDRTLFDIVEKTIETQRSEWDDKNIPFYSVTMIPFVLPTGGRIVGNARTGRCLGYGRYQSFVVYASDDCPLQPLIHLFNHEMMHDWIGSKIDVGTPDETASLRWFVEGFTEYYALHNIWRAGFNNVDVFLHTLNKDYLAAHYADPYGETPNLLMERDYYTTTHYEDLPYRRGCVLALYLDCAIRQKTGNRESLHDFMLDLLDYTYGKRRNLLDNFDFFSETLADYLGEELAETFLSQYVDDGKRLALEDFLLPDFLEMEW